LIVCIVSGFVAEVGIYITIVIKITAPTYNIKSGNLLHSACH